MSTYLQGVQDYIPQIQPYQPDLNLYNNLLQTKQTQYDTNWKALNKMYSQYYNAELSRTDTAEKKDNYIKQATFNLQRVSQLDLSLEQNVNQATQVFKPLYEDKLLMKDMAYTKNFNSQKGKASALKGSINKEDNEKYWDTGVMAMDYQRQEFKNASAEEAMGFGNVEYTPFVNVTKEARKLAKESGLSIEVPSMSEDGRYIIKTKNGENLIEPLSKLFEAELGSDPGVQAVYKTQAYVNRKNYAASNAALFKGGEAEAELKYLENEFTELKEQNQRRYVALKENSVTYDARIADLKKQIENKTATPSTLKELKAYEMNKSINDKVLQRVQEEQEDLDNDQSEGSTTMTGFKNPYGDIKSLRWKVDNAVAGDLMMKKFNEAAEVLAYRDYKVDMKADIYKVKEIDHSYRMSEIASRNAGLERAAALRNQGTSKANRDKYLVEQLGTHEYDENGNAVPIEGLNNIYTKGRDVDATDAGNIKEVSKNSISIYTKDYAMPYLSGMVGMLDNLKNKGVISDAQLKQLIKYNDKTDVNWDKFKVLLKGQYSAEYISNKIGVKGLERIKKQFDNYVSKNSKLSQFQPSNEQFNKTEQAGARLNDYYLAVNADKEWRQKTAPVVVDHMQKTLPPELRKYAKYAYDENGNFRSEKDLMSTLIKNKVLSKDQLAEYIAGKEKKFGKAGYDEAVKLIGDTDYIQKYGTGLIQVLKKARDIINMIPSPGASYYVDKKGNPAKKETFDIGYNDIRQAAAQAYSNSNLNLKAPPAILGSGSGTSTMNQDKTIDVNLKGHSINKSRWMDVFNDLNKIDFNDKSKYNVSLLGVGETGYAKMGTKGYDRGNIGMGTLDAIRREMNNPKTKFGQFTVSVLPNTSGKSNQAAIIVRPPSEWIDANTSTFTGTGDDRKLVKAGIFTPEQAQAAKNNGVSYLMPAKEMNNQIYKSYFNDPIAMYLNSGDNKVYTQTLADPRWSVSISKNEMSQDGTYNVEGKYVTFKNGEEVEADFSTVGLLGDNLLNTRDQLLYSVYPQIYQGLITDFNSSTYGE